MRQPASGLRRALAALTLAVLPAMAAAETVPFDSAWKEQSFLSLWSNDYRKSGARLDVLSEGTVSLLWRPVEAGARDATAASWAWAVAEGVVPTDLSQKGGDDRNLALYFVFVDPETADGLTRNSARRLLRDPNTRALVYVWGGAHARGQVLQSPYHPQLRTKVLRPAGTGQFSERIDLAGDFRAQFGSAPGVLVGLAVSADSDDTDGRIRASIANITLR